ncbi:MAG: sensor histidine kinase [Clostridiales bacterium]|nr:sensor histidine kinase [Clostridiales bacterium]
MTRKYIPKKRISTGSFALRMALANALDILVILLFVDLLFFMILIWPDLSQARGPEEFFGVIIPLLKDVFSGRNFALLLQVEGIIVLVSIFSNTFKLKSQLKPLDEMAAAAEELLNMDMLSEERFQKLEEAIESYSPLSEAKGISTGDNELAGLENAVNKLVDRIRASYKQQARFVSDASHELRTPISVIRGYADMLDRWGKDDEKVLKESIDAIRSETASMQRLVEQLLFLARADSGRQQLEMKDFNLSDLALEVCEESEMIDAGHKYVFRGERDIRARGDVSMLKQCARILTENAKKYSPEGGEIIIKVFRQGGRPAFSVQDSGIGISAEEAPQIFERFYRADDSRSKQSGGSGLGLSIAKMIIDRHGGSIEVVSHKGTGTRMSVIL